MKKRLLTGLFLLGAMTTFSSLNQASAHTKYVGLHQPYTESGSIQREQYLKNNVYNKASRNTPNVGSRVIYTYREVGTSPYQYSVEPAPPIPTYYGGYHGGCHHGCW